MPLGKMEDSSLGSGRYGEASPYPPWQITSTFFYINKECFFNTGSELRAVKGSQSKLLIWNRIIRSVNPRTITWTPTYPTNPVNIDGNHAERVGEFLVDKISSTDGLLIPTNRVSHWNEECISWPKYSSRTTERESRKDWSLQFNFKEH